MKKQFSMVAKKTMLDESWAGTNTICQLLRELYLEIPDRKVRTKLRIVMSMAKRMHGKLEVFKAKERKIGNV